MVRDGGAMLKKYSELIQLANACGESQVLLSANTLSVFTAIGRNTLTTAEIARECHADPVSPTLPSPKGGGNIVLHRGQQGSAVGSR